MRLLQQLYDNLLAREVVRESARSYMWRMFIHYGTDFRQELIMYIPLPPELSMWRGSMRIFRGDLFLRDGCYYVEPMVDPPYEVEVAPDKWHHVYRSTVMLLGKPGINWRIVWQDPKIRWSPEDQFIHLHDPEGLVYR